MRGAPVPPPRTAAVAAAAATAVIVASASTNIARRALTNPRTADSPPEATDLTHRRPRRRGPTAAARRPFPPLWRGDGTRGDRRATPTASRAVTFGMGDLGRGRRRGSTPPLWESRSHGRDTRKPASRPQRGGSILRRTLPRTSGGGGMIRAPPLQHPSNPLLAASGERRRVSKALRRGAENLYYHTCGTPSIEVVPQSYGRRTARSARVRLVLCLVAPNMAKSSWVVTAGRGSSVLLVQPPVSGPMDGRGGRDHWAVIVDLGLTL